jgi:hypothetical protein
MNWLGGVDGLRSVAMTLADHGWPVVRGTYRDGAGWQGRPGRADLVPVDEDWPNCWTLDVDRVAAWWSRIPYSVLVVCGEGVDCLEVPGRYGARLLVALAGAGLFPPAMLTPTGGLVLFVRTDPRAVALVSATLCALGQWVAVPPTGQEPDRNRRGYQWVPGQSPDRLGWRLPELKPVYQVIVNTVTTAADRPEGRAAAEVGWV